MSRVEIPKETAIKNELDRQGKLVDTSFSIITGVLVVVAFGFITLIIQYFQLQQTTYQNLVNQVSEQNYKVDTLIKLNAKIK